MLPDEDDEHGSRKAKLTISLTDPHVKTVTAVIDVIIPRSFGSGANFGFVRSLPLCRERHTMRIQKIDSVLTDATSFSTRRVVHA